MSADIYTEYYPKDLIQFAKTKGYLVYIDANASGWHSTSTDLLDDDFLDRCKKFGEWDNEGQCYIFETDAITKFAKAGNLPDYMIDRLLHKIGDSTLIVWVRQKGEKSK